MNGPRVCTIVGVAMLLVAGIFNTDPTAWRDLLTTFVVWFALFDWDRGIRPLDRAHIYGAT